VWSVATGPQQQLVPSGAIATALLMVESVPECSDGAEAVLFGFEQRSRETMLEVFGTLIYTAINVMRPASEEDDRLHVVLLAVVSRFRRLELAEVPAEALPVVAGIITAAAVGLAPYTWRLSLGP
jgi:hypothetical protein